MRSAETVLAIIRTRGEQKLPLENVYRLFYNRDLFLLAYSRICKNDGALTPGTDGATVDGMSLQVIDTIIDHLKHERYRWDPAKRVYIEKRRSKTMRPLGIPTWSDKLVQEVIRLILEAYYEPRFSPNSHGFRPNRGCHTALRQVYYSWKGVTWFIEGDIRGCFDTIDHQVLVSILAEDIHDNRFIRLIGYALKAGFMEQGVWHPTSRGTPQGGIASPLLANIYLDHLDRFVEGTLLPQWNRGIERKQNLPYHRLLCQASELRKQGRWREAEAAKRAAQRLPSLDPDDPNYRRLTYIRYADDFLLGFIGPQVDAEEIKRQINEFLQTIKLELSEGKTLITHARTSCARFLGYDLHTYQSDSKHKWGNRSVNGKLGLRVPRDVIDEHCTRYLKHGKPIHRPEMTNDAVYSIVAHYQQEYRGVVNYYRLAYNLASLNKLRWIMEQSLTKTLAHKLKISVKKVYARYATRAATPHGPRKVLRCVVERPGKEPLVATWGGISLRHNPHGNFDAPTTRVYNRWTDALERLLADECELCGSTENVQVHHIRRMTDLTKPGRREKPEWVKIMAARNRKTMAVCFNCHRGPNGIHAVMGPNVRERRTGEPDDRKRSRPVRRGVAGKVPPVTARDPCR